MKKTNTIIIFVLLILVIITLIINYNYKHSEKYTNTTYLEKEKTAQVIVDTTMPPIEDKSAIIGNKDDLVAFSVVPNTKVHGILSYRGVIKGGYFFEGNILINVLDMNKNVLKASNAVAKTDWMTAEPVNFEGNIDFTGLKKGNAYLEIHNDNASGLPENDKSILIPIIIE